MKLFYSIVIWVIVKFDENMSADALFCNKTFPVLVNVYKNGIQKSVYVNKTTQACCKGYALYRRNCIPLCNKLCVNGKCIAPNFCACNEGYKRFDDFTCVCDNAGCNLDTTTDFSSTYSTTEFNEFILPTFTDITDEFSTVLDITASEIIALDVNASEGTTLEVIAPEVTTPKVTALEETQSRPCDSDECNPGDCVEGVCKWFETKTCIPTCINGYCNENSICECRHGYELRNQSYCTPVCTLGCINGMCVAPNRCECWDGFIQHFDNGVPICRPKCNNDLGGCFNGSCVEPEVCKCHDGFTRSLENKFLCVPEIYKNTFIRSDNYLLFFLYILLVIMAVGSVVLVISYVNSVFAGEVYNIDKIEEKRNVHYLVNADDAVYYIDINTVNECT